MEKEKLKKTLFEFARYAVVGGIAALIDIGVNYATLHYILNSTKDDKLNVAISVAVGFAVGLLVNFFLSNLFVFKTTGQREKGRTLGAFLVYAMVGMIGLGLTEVLTIFGTTFIGEDGIWYILLCGAVKCVVLIWNYIGRKVFVYRGE